MARILGNVEASHTDVEAGLKPAPKDNFRRREICAAELGVTGPSLYWAT